MARPSPEETYRHYLLDLGSLLRETAIEANQGVLAAAGADAFEVGRLQAYWEVLHLMLSQAATFGLSVQDLALEGFDPDRDLMDLGGLI